ncbi:MAG TPA: tripartite tricarboxylate transporter substrate binding protein [Burkholderiales bacterium]|nr:tripartite tricarboxylate transporter substrate binding protein [Burkholderiales bacterium]
MNRLRRNLLSAGGALALGAGLPRLGAAQAAWKPVRDVRIMNGFAAGGSGELVCRIAAEALRPLLGQNVIVETQAGANGFIAAQTVARAAPDGHTVGMATMSMLTIAPQLPGVTLQINVETDLTPIANLAGIYSLLVVSPDAPFRTVPELIAYAKAKPGAVSYASAGVGSAPHLAAELFRSQAGIDILHVPYKGGAPAMLDVAAGRVQMMFGNLSDFLGQVKAGKLRGVAFGGDRAAPVLPDLPLIKQWLPNYSVSNWFSIVGPGHLPANITAAWNAALQKGLADPAMQSRLADLGAEVLVGSTERFQAEIAAYRANWAGVIRSAGIRAE